MAAYDPIAYFYDLSHQSLVEDIPFWIDKAADLGLGRPIQLLELGCGSGRLAIPLAQLGHSMVGIDLSASLLDIAKGHVQGTSAESRLTWIQGDMTDFDPAAIPPTDLVFVGHNTLMHLDDPAVVRCLKLAGRVLSQDGLLVIDLIHPDLLFNLPDDETPELEQQFPDPNTGRVISHFNTYRFNPDRTELTMTTTFVDQTPSGPNRVEMEAVYHLRHLHQLEQLIQHVPTLRLKAVDTHYQPEDGEQEPERLILTLEQSL